MDHILNFFSYLVDFEFKLVYFLVFVFFSKILNLTHSRRWTSEDSFLWKESSRSVKPKLTIIKTHLKYDQGPNNLTYTFTQSSPTHLELRQAHRRRIIRELCSANSSFNFPGKFKTFDQIPSKALGHLIVDDRHGVIYCFVPKVACTNCKGIMIVLSQNLKTVWTLRQLMHHKLKNYTKFLFIRDPFVRLISAFRNKFALPNEDFYIQLSFTHFIKYLLDPQTEKEKHFNEHWQQIYRLCHPCQIEYDFVGKLETLDEDTEHLLKILGMENQICFPPGYRNRTAANWERDWFANISVADRRKLYNLYEADFRLFGYGKP
uniref:Carbohydrate sulfotransferase n=1 Tax=Sinocyclocheilus rhinocerous TaxID=307959 RepID=A0A673GMM9_9TELE